MLAGIVLADPARDLSGQVGRMLALARSRFLAHDRIWAGEGAALGASTAGETCDGPVIGGGGALVLVADLRLDNRADIAGRLGLPADRLRGLSDAALLMAAFERWGPDCCRHLRGDYAFAVWDGRARRLVLAVDPVGQRQMLYHRGRDFFAIANRAAALHGLTEVPVAPDLERLRGFIGATGAPGAATFFDGISRVLPGHYLVLTGQVETSVRHWEPEMSPRQLPKPSEYGEALREVLDRAVARRLGGTGQVGVQLSAGLDSAAVASAATRQLTGGRLTAFTAVPQPGFRSARRDVLWDEGPLAREIAAACPEMDHVMVSAGERSIVEDMALGARLAERPILNPCNAGWLYEMNDAAHARDVRVLLTGQLGNLHFSYAGAEAFPELVAEGRVVEWVRVARGCVRAGSADWARVVWWSLAPFAPQLYTARRYLSHSGGSRDDQVFLAGPPEAAVLPARRKGWRAVPARLFGMRRFELGPYNMAARTGWNIEQRDPTADQDLIEFCLRVPTAAFLEGGRPRALALACLQGRVPEAVLSERRRGYQGADWHARMLSDRDRLMALLDRVATLPAAGQVLDLAAMRRALESLHERDGDSDSAVRTLRLGLLRAFSAASFLDAFSGRAPG